MVNSLSMQKFSWLVFCGLLFSLNILVFTIEKCRNRSTAAENSTLRVHQAAVNSCVARQHSVDSEDGLVASSATDLSVAGKVASIEGPADDHRGVSSASE